MLKKWIEKLRRKQELRRMDEIWKLTDARSWTLFPPSFYATHTKEEIRLAEEQQLAECHELLKQLN